MLESSDMDLPTDNNVEILRVMTKFEQDNIADPVTNNHFWKRYFRGKADVFKGFVDGMKDVYDDIDKICKDESTRGSNEHIRAVYTILRDVDKKLIDKMEHDGNLCLAIKNDFGDFKDEEKNDLILHNKEHQLTHARKQLLEQRRAVERKKEKYHRTAFKLEKAEIKKAIAEKEEDIKKHEKTFRHLQKKVEKRLKKYQKEHAKLPNLTTIVKEKSSDCSTVRTEVDVKRAEFILEKLEKYCNEAKTRSGDLQKAEFEKIDVNELVKKRLIIEDFKVPRTTEKYVGTKNKHELFEQVRKEMAEDRERRQRGEKEDDSSDDDDDDEVKAPNLRARSRRRLAQNETPVVPFNSAVNGGDDSPRPGPSGAHAGGSAEPGDGGSPRVKGVGSKYLVTTAYRKKAANEMNLPRGKIVKLIMPANDKGMAFGEKKGKIGGRKTKGYFPMECVVPAD